MSAEIITIQDLQQFKVELLQELKQLLTQPSATTDKQWLKSAEVRKLLGISAGTLQNLRINGTLRYSKVDGIMYYQSKDISKLLESNARL